MTIKISICMGSSCFARGNSKNLVAIEDYIKENNIDAKIELTGLRCTENCSKGPNIIIDENEYNDVDKGSLIDIVKKHIEEDK